MMKIPDYMLDEQQQQEREALIVQLKNNRLIKDWLVKYGLSEDVISTYPLKLQSYLEVLSSCDKCLGLENCLYQPVGFAKDLVFDGFLKSELVACRYLVAQRQKIAHIKQYLRCDLSPEWLEYTFANLPLSKKLPVSYTSNVNKIKSNLDIPVTKGWYFYGGMGSGKTRLLACIANHFAKQGRTVCFINMSSFSNYLKSVMGEDRLMEHLLNDLKKCGILFIDDLGSTINSPWMRDEILMGILNERMDHQRLTYFSSNYSFEQLQKYFSSSDKGGYDVVAAQRIMERIMRLSEPLLFDGVNFRQES